MKTLLSILVSLSCLVAEANDNGRALTPPMGLALWYQWCGTNSVGTPTNFWTATMLTNLAQTMLTNGLAASGYKYFCIDVGWQSNRDSITHEPIVAGGAFPTGKPGMQGFIDYIHSVGLKFGGYFNKGTNGEFVYPYNSASPVAYPGVGSYLYYTNDARYASTSRWDYVMFDCSFSSLDTPFVATGAFYAGEILQTNYPATYATDTLSDPNIFYPLVNMWRGTSDIMTPGVPVTFQTLTNTVDTVIGYNNTRQRIGTFAHLDWIEIGMTNNPYYGPLNLSLQEQRSWFGMWSFFPSPLMISAEIRGMASSNLALYTQPELLAINQDALGTQCSAVSTFNGPGGSIKVYARPLSDGSTAVAVWNRSTVTTNVTVTFSSLGLPGRMAVRDCWNTNELGAFTGGFTCYPASHDCLIFKVHSPLTRVTITKRPAYYDAVAWTNLVEFHYAPSIVGNNNSFVTNWPDLAPGGTNPAQVFNVGTANPKLTVAAQNGLSAVTMSAATGNQNGFYSTNSYAMLIPQEVWVVMNPATVSTLQAVAGFHVFNGQSMAFGIGSSGLLSGWGLFSGYHAITTGWGIYRWKASALNCDLGSAQEDGFWINGLKDISACISMPTTIGQLYLGARYDDGSSSPFNGQIGEVRVFNKDLSPPEAKLLNYMMSTNWNIPLLEQ
jgi:alpha-galactosidase